MTDPITVTTITRDPAAAIWYPVHADAVADADRRMAANITYRAAPHPEGGWTVVPRCGGGYVMGAEVGR